MIVGLTFENFVSSLFLSFYLSLSLQQGLQQGGVFAFDGERTIFQYYDPSTGAHADMEEVMKLVTK